MEDLTPLYNKEFYLAHLCGEDVVLPIPDGNAERYLAYLCGMNVTIPDVPDGRTETYLAYKCGEDVVLPDPLYRIEFYLAKLCGMDVEVPEPLYRIEYWLAQLANSGELKTVTGNPISISDALAKPAESLSIEILPQQDLHGYANPWPAGGGVNLCNPSTMGNGFIQGSGSISISDTNGERYMNDYVPITGSQFTVGYFNYANDETTWTGVAFYDSNKTFIRRDSSSGSLMSYNVPQNAVYARATMRTYNHGNEYCFCANGEVSTYSPYSNICPITGFTGVNIYRESAYDPDADPTYSISWQDSAGTVYGGSLDVTSGVLTAVPYYGSYNGETLVGPWVSSMDKYVAGTTPTIGAQVVDLGGTGTEIQLSATEVDMLLGNNTIWNDVDGDMTLEYLADGPADDVDALQILLNNRYVNNGGEDEATDGEALDILLGGNTR